MLSRRHVFALLLLMLGADFAETPRRTYFIVFLRRNPDRKTLSKEEGERIQSAHMANIHAMADRGVLVAAGPFDDTPPAISGVFLFVLDTLEDARKLAESDPTVVAHRNSVETMAWRGPVGIGEEYRRLHRADPKTPEDMGVHPFLILRRSNRAPGEVLLRSHRAHWASLRTRGKVVAAGTVEGDPSAAAIVIFDRIPDDEALSLATSDPAVRAGFFAVEAHRWWCAAHVFPR